MCASRWRDTRRRLAELLPDAEQRLRDDGEAYVTDEGHLILDCALPADADLDALAVAVKQVPGVVEHGLFIGLAERALLGRADGSVDVLVERRPARGRRAFLRLSRPVDGVHAHAARGRRAGGRAGDLARRGGRGELDGLVRG